MDVNINRMNLSERRLEAELIRNSINMEPSESDFNTGVEYILKEKVVPKTELSSELTQIQDNRAQISLKLLVAKKNHSYIPQVMDEIMDNCGYKHSSPEYVGAKILLMNHSGMSSDQVDKQIGFYLDKNFMD